MNMLSCWIIPIIVGLICALLGYLLGKMCSRKCRKSHTECKDDKCEKKCLQLEESLQAKENQILDLQVQIKKLEDELVGKPIVNEVVNLSSFKTETSAVTSQFVFDAGQAALILGKKIKEDDLTVVEGIGPKIQELFKNSGITTWKILSETSPERLKEILTEGGERFAIHNPGTWPRQAELAYKGKWEELKEWQEFLVGGVEPS